MYVTMALSAVSSITDTYLENNEATCFDDDLVVEKLDLYGRHEETQQLVSAYQKSIWGDNPASVVFVHGVSGIGKTTLIEASLRDRVCDNQGYFCAGKFFQNSSTQQEPYSAIMAALSDLCDLIRQSDDFEEHKRLVRSQLGVGDLMLLSNVISNISVFVEEEYNKNHQAHYNLGKTETAFAKFKVVCKAFLYAVSSRKHPIVLFIDDIQWMDAGSRLLIEMFLHDEELKHICFVFAYRDEESEEMVPLLRNNKNLIARLVDVQVNRLDVNATCQLVQGFLGATCTDKIRELSELVFQRSNGNPFHCLQFLEMTVTEKLISYDDKIEAWEFDVEDIQKETMVSETLATILFRKVQRLPPPVQETLKVAALLGFRFSKDILVEVVAGFASFDNSTTLNDDSFKTTSATTASDTTRSLSAAASMGFVEQTNEGFQFSHDKLQSAFRDMIDEAEAAQFHRMIGETFWARGDPESMYQAAVHLNIAPRDIGVSYRIKLAKANLEAAKFCKTKAAFSDGTTFLERGLDELNQDNNKWKAHFDLVFEMTELLAQMQLVVGEHERCKKTIREVLTHGKSLEMKLNSLVLDVENRMATHQLDECIDSAKEALIELGVWMPRNVTMRHVVFKLLKVKRMIGRKSDKQIMSLPRIQDRINMAILKLLVHVCLYCLLKDEENQATYAALLATELTMKNGLSAYSSSAFIVYGVAETALGNIERGYRFGNLSARLMEEMPCKEVECNVIIMRAAIMGHWKEPMHELVPQFDRATTSGFDTGDVVYGIFASSNCFTVRVLLGMFLPNLEVYMRSLYAHICEYRQDERTIMWTQPSFQWCLNMQSHPSSWSHLKCLNGEIMEEADYMKQCIADGHKVLMATLWIHKLMLNYDFGFYHEARRVINNLATTGNSTRFHFSFRLIHFYASLTYYALCRGGKSRKSLRLARKYKRSFQTPADCPNNPGPLALLTAEDLSVQKNSRKDKVLAAYDDAIAAMHNQKLFHFEGTANERAGYYALGVGAHQLAMEYFERAMKLYRDQWGAVAKYEWLKEQVARQQRKARNSALGNIIRVEPKKESSARLASISE